MASDQNLDSELESFRRQWLSDLRSRTDHSGNASQGTPASGPSHPALSSRHLRGTSQSSAAAAAAVPEVRRSAAAPIDDEHDAAYLHGPVFGDMPAQPGNTLESSISRPTKSKDKELLSALDHFEEAMIKEASGNMGDSLKLYRKAYKVRALFTT